MLHPLQQVYRHIVQQAILRDVIRSTRRTHPTERAWQTSGIAALFAAAAVCGSLAQLHLG